MLIDEEKKSLRKELRNQRDEISEEQHSDMDSSIFEKIISIEEYKNAETLLCYISVGSEVDTKKLIDYSIETGKKVAVPVCHSDEKGKMTFHYIADYRKLPLSKYNIPEPDINSEEYRGEKAFCIVPGFSFDNDFYRIGYGGGYYDRFIAKHNNICFAGVVFSEMIRESLPYGEYDCKVDMIITEKNIVRRTRSDGI